MVSLLVPEEVMFSLLTPEEVTVGGDMMLRSLSFLRSITKSYYRNSVGALLVYDICNRDSYKHIPVWMMEAKRHIEPHKAVFILVGCKLDLAADEDQVNISLCTVYTEI